MVSIGEPMCEPMWLEEPNEDVVCQVRIHAQPSIPRRRPFHGCAPDAIPSPNLVGLLRLGGVRLALLRRSQPAKPTSVDASGTLCLKLEDGVESPIYEHPACLAARDTYLCTIPATQNHPAAFQTVRLFPVHHDNLQQRCLCGIAAGPCQG